MIIIFYRGHWCPYCNRHIAQIQDSLGLIYKRGASVVAVSPQKPEYLNKTIEMTGTEFTLLYDEDYRISDLYDVTFLSEPGQLIKYNRFSGAQLKESHSDDTQRLPIPATYIVSKEGTIIWRQFDQDYKKRSDVKSILKALDEH